MESAEFSSTISGLWLSIAPVRVGVIPVGLGTPDCYVLVRTGSRLLRVDIYETPDSFRDVLIWKDFAVIGFGSSIFLVSLSTHHARTIKLQDYFGHLYCDGEVFLAASGSQLLRLDINGTLMWTSDELGIDGVIVDHIVDGIIHGQGEWDPPGGWRDFAVRLDSGSVIP
jgi:hypothetical protein